MQDTLVKGFVAYKMLGKILTAVFYAVILGGFAVIAGFIALSRALGSPGLAALTVGVVFTVPPMVALVRVLRWARGQQQTERDRGIEDVSSLWRILFHGTKTEKRKLQILRGWTKACAGQNFKPAPKLTHLQRTQDGDYKAIISSAGGLDVDDVGKKRSAVAHVIGCKEVGFTLLDGGRASLEFRWTDPLEREVTPQDMPAAPKGSVPIGRLVSGAAALPVTHKKTGQSTVTPILVGAATGAGKSNAVHAIIAGYIAAGIPLRAWIYDPKRQEFAAYRRHMGASANPLFEVAAYSGEPGGDVELLKDMAAELEERSKTQDDRYFVPSRENPINLFFCDEWFGLTKSILESKTSPLRRVMFIGRAFGFSAVALTQEATVENMGPHRNLFDRRIALRTRTTENTVAILGTRWAAEAGPAHLIPRSTPGVFYLDDDDTIVKGRFAHYDDDAVELLAQGIVPEGTAEGGDRPCHVYTYRAWNTEKRAPEIVYIGESFDVEKRWQEHQRDASSRIDKGWVAATQRFRQMREGRDLWRTQERFESKVKAREAERAAITAALAGGHPLHNEVHNPRWGRTRHLKAVA